MAAAGRSATCPPDLTHRDIATELYVSLNTVKTHCQAAYRKSASWTAGPRRQAARDLRLLQQLQQLRRQ